MDTSPWETAATKAGGDDEEWTAFEEAENTSNDSSGWADFSSLDGAPAADGGPRVSSPDALSDKVSRNDDSSSDSSSNAQAPDLAGQSKSDSSLDESLEQTPLSDDEPEAADSTTTTTNSGADTPTLATKDNNAVSMEVVSIIITTTVSM